MIKLRNMGSIARTITNPVLTSASTVANFDFITVDGETYLVANTITGDKAYVDDATFAAGEYLNGHALRAWVGEELVIDEKHIAYGMSQTYADITAGTTLLKINASGKLETVTPAPATGYYFKVTGKTRLTGNAVIAKICVGAGATPVTTLGGLTDVDTTGATNGQVLKYDGTKWAPATDATE